MPLGTFAAHTFAAHTFANAFGGGAVSPGDVIDDARVLTVGGDRVLRPRPSRIPALARGALPTIRLRPPRAGARGQARALAVLPTSAAQPPHAAATGAAVATIIDVPAPRVRPRAGMAWATVVVLRATSPRAAAHGAGHGSGGAPAARLDLLAATAAGGACGVAPLPRAQATPPPPSDPVHLRVAARRARRARRRRRGTGR